jgi:uncharacterized membrane protein
MMEYLNVVAIIVAGLMVGSELAIAAFVHPTLDRLPDNVHLPVASALARVLGRFMPFWYILVFLLTLAEVLFQWHQSSRLPIWIATSAVLWALASAYSITALVPINSRIASWEKVAPPANWKTYRSRWDLLHRWRVVLLTMAFAFLIVGVVSR